MGFTLHAFQPSIQDTLKSKLPDSLKVMSKADSAKSDSIQKKKQSGVKLKSKVDFKATDSLRFEVDKQKVYMFKDADVKYEDISMKSAYLEIDFPKSEVYATGVPDSTGKDQGIPDFAQGALSFKSKEMRYNYDTKRGFIKTVFTKQDEGYLHGTVVKKMENDVTYVKNGGIYDLRSS